MQSVKDRLALFLTQISLPRVNHVKKFSRHVFYRIIIGVLISQMAMPPLAFAPDPETDDKVGKAAGENPETLSRTTEELAGAKAAMEDTIAQVEGTAVGQHTRFALSAVQRNAGMLINQYMVRLSTGELYDLALVDLSRPDEKAAPGLAQRALGVTKIKNGIRLTLPGSKYAQDIYFSKVEEDGSHSSTDIELVDAFWDNETVELLLSDNSRHYIEVTSIEEFMFQSAIPVLYRGDVVSFGNRKVTKLRKIRRRYVSADRARTEVEGELNFDEGINGSTGTLARAALIADDSMAIKLEKNWEEIRPPELHPDFEAHLKANSIDGRVHYDAGDIALIHVDDSGREIIVGKQSALIGPALGGMQVDLIAAMQALASPDLGTTQRDLESLTEDGKRAIAEFINDPAMLIRANQSGLFSAISQMPIAGLNKFNEAVTKIFQAIDQARKVSASPENPGGNQVLARDHFTHDQWEEDHTKLRDIVDAAKTAAAEHAGQPRWKVQHGKNWRRFWRMGLGKKILGVGPAFARGINPARRMRQLTTVLKYPVIKRAIEKHKVVAGVTAAAVTGAAADYMFNHGNAAGAGIDLVMKQWSFVINHVAPVLQHPEYLWDMTRYSYSVRVAMLMSVIAIAAVFKPFSQHSINKLVTINGIKYCFSIFAVPLARLATLPLPSGRELLRAMKNGAFPAKFADFMDDEALAEHVEEASDKINDRNQLIFLARALAISVVAERKGLDPFELLQSTHLGQVQNLATNLANLLIHGKGHKLGEALASHGPDFVEALAEANRAAEELAMRGGTKRTGVFPYLRLIARAELLSSFSNSGEATFATLQNPQPSEAFATYVMAGYVTDGLLSLTSSSLVGQFASWENQTELAYQPNVPFFYTNTKVIINDQEQIGMHLGANAANDSQTFDTENTRPFSLYASAATLDYSRVQRSRTAVQDLSTIARMAIDVRSNNYLIMFGKRSFTQCISLGRSFLLLGLTLRLFQGVYEAGSLNAEVLGHLFSLNNLEFSTVGQLYFIFFAPFRYRYWWAFWVQTYQSMLKMVKGLAGDFPQQLILLQHDLSAGNTGAACARARKLIASLDSATISVSEHVKEAVKERAGESDEVWLARVLHTLRTDPSAPEKLNPSAIKGVFTVLAIVTTILATKLMDGSFDLRHFWGEGNPAGSWGFDPYQWLPLWDGIAPHDSVPVWTMKCVLNFYGVWLMGHAIEIIPQALKVANYEKMTPEEISRNEAVARQDRERQIRAVARIPGLAVPVRLVADAYAARKPRTPEQVREDAQAAKERLDTGLKDLGSVPGMGIVPIKALKTPVVRVNSIGKGTCAKMIEAHAPGEAPSIFGPGI